MTELFPYMIFDTVEGVTVQLDRRVPGDGTKWYAATRHSGTWFWEDYTIEPGDLVNRRRDLEKLEE